MADSNLNERVEKIKNNVQEIDKLIEEYKPFIASVVEKHIGRFVEYGVDDELSIALMAFHESIQKYDRLKGNFLSFARFIIKRRLVDYYRKQQKGSVEVYLEQAEELKQQKEDYDLSEGEAIKEYNEKQVSELRRLEIMEIKKELSLWGISFADVAKSSPKKKSTRKMYLKAAKYISESQEIMGIMKTKRYLPIDKIVSATKLPRKTIERGRNYIVAVAIILSGDYQYIREYVQWR